MSIIENTWVIIPAHNRREITLECLKHLQSTQNFKNFNTIVVDDGSTDRTGEMVRAGFPSVHLIKGDGSWWWTGSIRRGMEYAYDRGAEVFMWLVDDVRPDSGTVEQMATAVVENKNTVLSAMVYREPPYDSDLPRGIRRDVSRSGLRRLPYDDSEIFQDGDVVAGKFTAMQRSVVDAIGFPDDEKFPHHDGDFDYTLRAKEKGFRPAVYTPVKAKDVGEQGELSHTERLSPKKPFSSVLLDVLRPSRNSGQSFPHLYRKSMRFTPSPIFGLLLFLYLSGRTSAAVIYKLLLCIVRSEQPLRKQEV